ncbi:MAG: hypothetical protein KME42_21255 [Tildeniella nuda ZEHNDER 1965/U140]|nr:hypothetical protein [Tildeniella nuda ZEHNDER 1965/U140]
MVASCRLQRSSRQTVKLQSLWVQSADLLTTAETIPCNNGRFAIATLSLWIDKTLQRREIY